MSMTEKLEEVEGDVATETETLNEDAVAATKNGTTNGSVDSLVIPEKITSKAQLGDEIRLVSGLTENTTFDELVGSLKIVFKNRLDDGSFVVKYKDEDGDFVTIVNSSELSFAIQSCSPLKLKIIPEVPGQSKGKTGDSAISVDLICSELIELRDKVSKLIGYIDSQAKGTTTASNTITTVTSDVGNTGSESCDLSMTGVSVVYGNQCPSAPVSESETCDRMTNEAGDSSDPSFISSSIENGFYPTQEEQQITKQPQASSLFDTPPQGRLIPNQQNSQQMSPIIQGHLPMTPRYSATSQEYMGHASSVSPMASLTYTSAIQVSQSTGYVGPNYYVNSPVYSAAPGLIQGYITTAPVPSSYPLSTNSARPIMTPYSGADSGPRFPPPSSTGPMQSTAMNTSIGHQNPAAGTAPPGYRPVGPTATNVPSYRPAFGGPPPVVPPGGPPPNGPSGGPPQASNPYARTTGPPPPLIYRPQL